jgi:RNA polymerase sigma factor (sigma-70 family)
MPEQAASPDAQLFQRVAERDPAAWSAFVERFGPLVHAICRRTGVSEDEREDIAQTIWIKLLRHAEHLRCPASLPGWVATTANRECWRHVARARQAVEARQHLGDRVGEDQPPPGLDLEQLETVQRVRDAVARLEGRCAQLLTALFLKPETPSYEDLAQTLGVPVGSLGPTRQRCLARLAADFELGGERLEP